MAADALAPCIARTSSAMVLTMQDNCILVFYEERCRLPAPSQCVDMTVSNIGFITVHGLNEGHIEICRYDRKCVYLLKFPKTRTTRSPAFWWCPPPPPPPPMITHNIESYWIPSQKKTKSKLQILRIRQKFLNIETNITRDTPSEVAW